MQYPGYYILDRTKFHQVWCPESGDELLIYAYFNCELGVFVYYVDVEKSKSPTQHNGSMY